VSEQTTDEVTLKDQHLGRNGEGAEQLLEIRSMHLGRFSEGVEQLAETPGKLHLGRFSEGIEQLPETATKFRRGSFADGLGQARQRRATNHANSTAPASCVSATVAPFGLLYLPSSPAQLL
jgi:hypothetical protein